MFCLESALQCGITDTGNALNHLWCTCCTHFCDIDVTFFVRRVADTQQRMAGTGIAEDKRSTG